MPERDSERPERELRVAFALAGHGSGWLGGVSYYRNLFRALEEGKSSIVPLAVAPSGRLPDGFPRLELLKWSGLERRSLAWATRMVVRETMGSDLLLDRVLHAAGVHVLSHASWLGKLARTAAVGWIPDFQDRHLPRFFSSRELATRERTRKLLCARADLIIVSSGAAREDLSRYYPRAAERVRVLRFVDCGHLGEETPDKSHREEFGLPEQFFLLPNQFWAHKNHKLVIDALRVLRSRGTQVVVAATGNTSDPRQPEYFSELMRHCSDAGVSGDFRVLGIVPYPVLRGLMRESVAVINPSLFEGWSTTVEEAKSMGKKVLLSDIPVHREQAPARADYFSVSDPGELADLLWRTRAEHHPDTETRAARDAAESLPGRVRRFASEYENIIREAAAERS